MSDAFKMKKFQPADGTFEIDPVCEMKVNASAPPFTATYAGKAYYFCAEACKILFERMPEKYIKEESKQENHHA